MRRSTRNVDRKDYKLLSEGKTAPPVKETVLPSTPPPPLPAAPPSPVPSTTSAGETTTPPTTPPPPPPPADLSLPEKDQIDLVRKLYLDVKFPGSFSGGKIMQQEVFLKTGLNIPIEVVYKALQTIPTYLTNMRPIRKFPVAKYDVFTMGEVVQGKNSTIAS
jgi:hypothetical protein